MRQFVVCVGNAKTGSEVHSINAFVDSHLAQCIGQYATEDGCYIIPNIPVFKTRQQLQAALSEHRSEPYFIVESLETELSWATRNMIIDAVTLGVDVLNFMPYRLESDDSISDYVTHSSSSVKDIAFPRSLINWTSNEKRIIVLGTDDCTGKSYTANRIARALEMSNTLAHVESITPEGIIANNFIELLDERRLSTLENYVSMIVGLNTQAWKIIDTPGSLFVPNSSALTYAVMSASAAPKIVLCYDQYRNRLLKSSRKHPRLTDALADVLNVASLINDNAEIIGVSLYGPTQPSDVECSCFELSERYGVPVFNISEPNSMFFDMLADLVITHED